MDTQTVFELLAAPGPYPEHSEELMLYGQFVGAWDVASEWYGTDGKVRSAKGEWHFGWILGGRGIQDVLFASGTPADRRGTTLRCYDHAACTWHITWMQPYGSEFVHLIGRLAGNRIVQEGAGTDPGRRERWSFTEITPDSFTWLGEVSTDSGESWFLEQRMKAVRRTPVAAG